MNNSEQEVIMEYRLPTQNDKDALDFFILEHIRNGEFDILIQQDLFEIDFEKWLHFITTCAQEGKPGWGKSLFLLCIEDDKLIGLLSIRYELSKELEEKYGHIGYIVRPSERKKGYAVRMLLKALDICKECGLKKVLLGCFKDNIASAKVIKKCGGVLIDENDNYEKGKLSQYYMIKL